MTSFKFRDSVRRAIAVGTAVLIVAGAGASAINNSGMAQTTV
jgi:hypothetical protein